MLVAAQVFGDGRGMDTEGKVAIAVKPQVKYTLGPRSGALCPEQNRDGRMDP
eukprot:SAG11_NODE_1203_length_5535_cov_13.559235_2_plen_52_part_00